MINPRIFTIVGLILAILAFILVGYNCHIAFEDKNITVVTSLLVPFGIIGILIERFVNIFLCPDENAALKNQIRTAGLSSAATSDSMHNHSKKFSRYSFILGLVIAAFGFRFFTQVAQTDCSAALTNGVNYAYIFSLVDVFLTAILLSGGSQLINRLVQYLTPTPDGK